MSKNLVTNPEFSYDRYAPKMGGYGQSLAMVLMVFVVLKIILTTAVLLQNFFSYPSFEQAWNSFKDLILLIADSVVAIWLWSLINNSENDFAEFRSGLVYLAVILLLVTLMNLYYNATQYGIKLALRFDGIDGLAIATFLLMIVWRLGSSRNQSGTSTALFIALCFVAILCMGVAINNGLDNVASYEDNSDETGLASKLMGFSLPAVYFIPCLMALWGAHVIIRFPAFLRITLAIAMIIVSFFTLILFMPSQATIAFGDEATRLLRIFRFMASLMVAGIALIIMAIQLLRNTGLIENLQPKA